MFGDKAYWIDIDKNVQKMTAEKKFVEAVKYLEDEHAKYLKWREENPSVTYFGGSYINDLYFQLAKAKEAAGAPKKSLIDEYKRAVFSQRHVGEALTWLFVNLPLEEYTPVVKEVIKKCKASGLEYVDITKQLESGNNWEAFTAFLDVLLAQAEDPIDIIKPIDRGIINSEVWKPKFDEYCKAKPNLTKYMYAKEFKAAEESIAKENFTDAVSIYRNILKGAASSDQRPEIEFKICECLFNDGKYKETLSELDRFIARNKSSNRSLAKEALLMKGKCYVQLDEIDKASEQFFVLVIEYPETTPTAEANFYIGYCYMLQGKSEQAKEAFNLVIKDYPESSYASKAKLCLIRIEKSVVIVK
jgi:TolA-binding protein